MFEGLKKEHQLTMKGKMMSNFQSTTRELLAQLLNGEQPIPRTNPRNGESAYYYLKPKSGEANESLSNMDVIEAQTMPSPSHNGSAQQTPIDTRSDVEKWLDEVQEKMAPYGGVELSRLKYAAHPFYDDQGAQVYEWCDPSNPSACHPTSPSQMGAVLGTTPGYATYNVPDFTANRYRPSIRDAFEELLRDR